jgi:hypothetical protein
MLPNFCVVSTNTTTVYTGVSSCLVVRTLRTSSCGRSTAPHLKQYCNDPCVETVFVCLLLCVSVVHSGSVTVALCCTADRRRLQSVLMSVHAERHALMGNEFGMTCLQKILFPVVFMGVKLRHSHWGRNVGWEWLRIGCWGEYLGLRGTR